MAIWTSISPPSASCRVSRDVMSQSASRKSWSGMTSSFPSTVNRGFPPQSHEARGHGYLAYMHDPLAAAVAMDPELLTTRTATVDVDPTGATVTDWSGKRNPNARIGMSVDPAVFFDRFVERIGRFARRT